jgi:hypothetical protein
VRIAAVAAAVVLALNASSSAPTAAEPTTVIVELFTSEGCSDCPPADVLLQRLIDASPVPGAQVIGLGQHVDYWDRQGWRDRFSSGAFTARQRIYAARFANASIYTPQMVVDGRAELVGSDAAAARKAIERAAAASHGVVRIEIEPGSANKLAVSVAARDLPHEGRGDRADLFVAVTEDRLRSEVTRGENHGRTLAHAAVVRYLASIGEAASETAAARADIPIGSDWRRENLKVVAFVQARRDRTIVASAALPLSRGAR